MSPTRGAIGPFVLALAALCAAVVFLPPEGNVGRPLHDFVTTLLGPTAFALPLGLAFVGVLMTLQRLKPSVVLPRKRLLGVALVAIGVIAAEDLLGGASLVGQWLISPLNATFGAPVTAVFAIVVIAVGAWLVFDIRLRKKPRAAAS